MLRPKTGLCVHACRIVQSFSRREDETARTPGRLAVVIRPGTTPTEDPLHSAVSPAMIPRIQTRRANCPGSAGGQMTMASEEAAAHSLPGGRVVTGRGAHSLPAASRQFERQ